MILTLHLTPKLGSKTYFLALSRHSYIIRLPRISSLSTNTYKNSSDSSIVISDLPQKDFAGKLPQFYEVSSVESEWYNWWEQNGFFKAASHPRGDFSSVKPFSMILPPPNITGTLHLGHALTVTVQDTIARWRRMCGQDVVWIPGTDHAGIATQLVVEKQLLAQQKTTRHEIGREKFISEIWKWQRENGSHIQYQLRLMGASLDWSKEYFTLDETRSKAVVEAFIHLFEEGLIYRSNVPVNWSCWLQSTISDIEIDTIEIEGPTTLKVPGYDKPVQFGTLTNIVYKGCDNETEIVVSTTRPETMLGDVAIAVHPDDDRFTHLHGSFFWHPYRQQKIPLVCDTFVKQEFGTGAVKITPAHDRADYEVAKRHNLPLVPVINEHGEILDSFGICKGMKRFNARELIKRDLASQGLLQEESPHKMTIPVCGRSGDVIELIPKPQWFLSTANMGQKAKKAVKESLLCLTPPQAEQLWNEWFENHQDWCLSRQLWWGHRIPLFQCYLTGESTQKWVAARSDKEAKIKVSSHFSCKPDDPKLVALQDDDVLDTWFSSSVLPFSCFGWPEKVDNLKNVYPLSLMVTGNDILLFWVSRMVILGEHLMGQLPFSDVFLHGIIRDASGKKMSKSRGNVVSPEDIREGRSLKDLVDQVTVSSKLGIISPDELKKAIQNQQKMFPNGIPQCGTDALRFTLLSYELHRRFIDFDVSDCASTLRFCNKIWQVCRYVEGFMEQYNGPTSLPLRTCQSLTVMDRWILSKLASCITKLDKNLDKLMLNECVQSLRYFIHHEFCDVYIENTKLLRENSDSKVMESTMKVLAICVQNIIVLLAPFMPFLSEELYHRIPYIEDRCNSVSQHPYPQTREWQTWQHLNLEKEVDIILQIASTIRNLKGRNGQKLRKKMPVKLATNSEEELQCFLKHQNLLETLSFSTVREVSKSSENLSSTDYMLEERLGDNAIVTLILEDENDILLSEKHHSTLIIIALKKKLKLDRGILKTKRYLNSQHFLTLSQEDKVALHQKLTILEGETEKIDIFLNKSPELRDKLQEQLNQEFSSS